MTKITTSGRFQKLFEKIKLGETKKAELFAEATKELSKGSDLSNNQDISF